MTNADSRVRYAALPVRPIRRPDEWTETYLASAARAIGIRRPWRYDMEALRPILPAASVGNDDGRPRYGVDPLPAWGVQTRGAQIRVCAACFMASGYVRARWRLSHLTVCTTHGIVLTEGLVEPAITANYKRPDKRTVEDAASDGVIEGARCPTPAGLSFARQMWQPFEEAICSNSAEPLVTSHLAWALLAERLLEKVVTATRGPGYPSKEEPRHEHRAAWLTKEGMNIGPRYSDVLSFVLALRSPNHRKAAIACLTQLIGDECRRRTIMSMLPLEDLKARLLAAKPGKEVTRCGALPRSMHPPSGKSLDAAGRILGCAPEFLDLLARRDELKGVVEIQFGRKRYCFVPDAEVDRLRELFASWMTFTELLETLGIDNRGYRALHDAGFLLPVRFGHLRRYRRQDVSALLSRLDSVSRPLPDRRDGLQPVMGEWMHMRGRTRAHIKVLLDDMLASRIPVYRRLGGDGLAAYYVDHQAPDRLRRATEAHYSSRLRGRPPADHLTLWESA